MSIWNEAIDLSDIPKNEWVGKYMGNGYRNCCYRTDDQRNGQIILFGYDVEGNPKTFICPHKSHIKYQVKYKTREKDIYGNYVETKFFKSSFERKKYLEGVGDSLKVIECFNPETEFLHEMFDHVALDDSFNTYGLRTHFFDIETEISDEGFEHASTARQRINMLTVYDTKTEKYYTWSLEHCEKEFGDEYDESGKLINECPLKDIPKDRFVVYEFNNSERDLLSHFLDWFEENYPDVLCGFNSQAFDLGYVINRVERVLGDARNVDERKFKYSPVTRRLSPIGKIRVRENHLDNERANKQAEELYDLDGIFSADVLVLYKEKFKISQPLDGGNGLDNIGEHECGIHKIRYKNTKAPNGETIHSLKDLYLKDWNRFYKYNVMDVYVLKVVEEKVKTIQLSKAITSSGLNNFNSIYSSIGYLVGSLSMYAKTQMGTVFTSYKSEKKEAIPYEGAFCFPITPGLYKKGVCTVDFASLYPSSIRASNVSVETYVGKISRFPINDPASEFFSKEPPIDLYGMDIIPESQRTDEEKQYQAKYSHILNSVPKDSEIEKFYLLPADGSSQKVITREQLDRWISEKCIFTRNNTLLLKHSVKQGVISGWSKHFYALRKATKKKMQKLEMDIYKGLVKEEELEKTKTLIQNLHDRQQSLKICLNSIYGCVSAPPSPIYNPYLAQTITRTGKFCNLSAAEHIRRHFKDEYKTNENYIAQLGGDTDSSFGLTVLRVEIDEKV